MEDIPTAVWIAVVALSVAVSLIVIFAAGATGRGAESDPDASQLAKTREVSFLFHGSQLVDCDAEAAAMPPGGIESWRDLHQWLSFRFPELPARIDEVATVAGRELAPTETSDGGRLLLDQADGVTRVTLRQARPPSAADSHEVVRLRRKITLLSAATETAPDPIWITDADGAQVWCNTACEMAAELPGKWNTEGQAAEPGRDTRSRIEIPVSAGDPHQYEVACEVTGHMTVHHARDVTRLVAAETAQSSFVQTLTKTFANLATGLAVFDYERRLALFNPALVDLTGLRAEFLSARPHFTSFFDRLRDNGAMPEPRSYSSWRRRLEDLATRANGEAFQETWNLPGDVTYRVTGQPHPDGALVFLFEDISPEVAMTRGTRRQLWLHQAALDALESSAVLFGPDGRLCFTNAACREALRLDPDGAVTDLSISDFITACQVARPVPELWQAVETRLRNGTAPGTAWHRQAPLSHGGFLRCTVSSLPGGATMLSWTETGPVRNAQEASVHG
ncbi:PAS-domain containing protein [Roseovarius salinarum]|uniref:PAS-domain containing protein n=1 Tax=Roseovarius salinarum TaxID=1981892 RepID=UPI000C325076|nr:PAS-domain containing protein [Roseovarius salinarum]